MDGVAEAFSIFGISMIQNLQIKEQSFVLHPTGALYWEDHKMLLISDVHLGKVTHFRKYGAAIPAKVIHKNFELLDTVMKQYRPSRLCFLGDLFHSNINSEWKYFEDWTAKYSTWIWLVAGNHDIISPLKFESLGMNIQREIQVGEFLLTHHPVHRENVFNISGHIHPAIRLKGKGRQSLKLPCFFKSTDQLILPAFGQFTGTHILEISKDSEVFACTGTEVVKI